ncbi:MAG TPA: PEP-CTERM sorting domain-containing protein [Pirellulales bacterium]|jgi:hypothetical protein|nr:PEP-CTERM sorting domain-containing protein [Pirellulales bacterium]
MMTINKTFARFSPALVALALVSMLPALAAALSMMFGGTALADVVLPTQAQLSALGATQYQIAFVTTDSTNAESGLESTYNSIAAEDAAANATLNSLGATWTAVTSTLSGSTYTDASTNAQTYSGVPIFNTLGQLVLSNGAQFYTPTAIFSNPIDYTETGAQTTSFLSEVWTGGNLNVQPIFPSNEEDLALGTSIPWFGEAQNTIAPWDADGDENALGPLPIYALSSTISAVPEPSSLALLGIGAGALCLVYRRRR